MTAYDMNTLEKYYENFDAYVNPQFNQFSQAIISNINYKKHKI